MFEFSSLNIACVGTVTGQETTGKAKKSHIDHIASEDSTTYTM